MEHSALRLESYIDTQRESGADLVAAYQQGDRDAFRRLYLRYKDRVYSIAIGFMHGDAAAAEDITQDVFVRLHAALGGFRSESDFSTWLYRVVSNACMDELRKRKRIVQMETIESKGKADNNSQDDEYARLDLKNTVQSALDSLPDDARLAVMLKYFEELSYDEMAAAMNCRKGTVASRLNRALKTLALKLAGLNEDNGGCG